MLDRLIFIKFQVHATDKDSGLNGEIRYELLPSHAADHFSVDAVTGQIRLIRAFGDSPAQLRFRVAAKDRAEPPMQGLAEVWIDLTKDAKFTNENPPEFDDASFLFEFRCIVGNFSFGTNSLVRCQFRQVHWLQQCTQVIPMTEKTDVFGTNLRRTRRRQRSSQLTRR